MMTGTNDTVAIYKSILISYVQLIIGFGLLICEAFVENAIISLKITRLLP